MGIGIGAGVEERFMCLALLTSPSVAEALGKFKNFPSAFECVDAFFNSGHGLMVGEQEALIFVFNKKTPAFPAGELLGAGLLSVEMVKAGFPGKDFPSLGDFQSLGK